MVGYDIVIVGAGIMGASVAWHLTEAGSDARIAVIERDPRFTRAGSTATNSCLRQQFTTPTNILASRYTAEIIRDFPAHARDARAPGIALDPFGYLYLAADPPAADALRRAHALQTSLGAGTVLLDRAALAARFPFIRGGDIVLASWGSRDEGYFDGHAMWSHWRRAARDRGVVFLEGEVAAVSRAAELGRVTGVSLADGTRLACGWLVNAAGGRAADLAAMAGISIPVERRKRFTYVFEAERPLPAPLPLTVDPCGVHMRSDGRLYMAGAAPQPDLPVSADDFDDRPALWEERVWPALAARVPAFEAIRLRRSWVGHYDFNTFDRNALLGPAPDCPNLILCCGFSGHGLQHAPAVGRGAAELILTGAFRSLDLGAYAPTRLAAPPASAEGAVI
ncbi:NAD(P)/FAD-dependent oxidoreductase [Palleronia rufa]|uniref:NAD(P)/FAD-dependent oxidoreductase n=1 Tax=Palleronia rufa TaxID=1530186 RepID=UPI0005612650|nr:FAD-dependent oxidoreductase [Palleronia rufa]